ncbi:hypothetical protein CCR75_000560 [Bremia lactucae]|uniref:Uncharacterized protein n=1 Tax=Bremia lactucae TaxID=4779 RepID=A0A976IK52_BRELC|nr:hypothetical protein CCR75_000560 [Bremia lactucae]
MGSSFSKVTTSQPDVPKDWDATHIPSQKNKIAIVTGGNSGIGFIVALELARKGADVILACRNRERGLKAEADIQELIRSAPEPGTVKFVLVDMGDLSSVDRFCETFKKMHPRLDLLINNAGIFGGKYTKTVDGYELQFATNYLGHFALTAHLFDQLKMSPSSRVIAVSSIIHRYANLFFDEDNIIANNEKEYGQMAAYSVSKLCNILFTFELDRRLKAAGIDNITAAAAHPGYSSTNIMQHALETNQDSWKWWVFIRTVSLAPQQSSETGGLSILYAATGDNVQGGDFFGPKYLGYYGFPSREDTSALSKSETEALKLWDFSENLTQIKFELK